MAVPLDGPRSAEKRRREERLTVSCGEETLSQAGLLVMEDKGALEAPLKGDETLSGHGEPRGDAVGAAILNMIGGLSMTGGAPPPLPPPGLAPPPGFARSAPPPGFAPPPGLAHVGVPSPSVVLAHDGSAGYGQGELAERKLDRNAVPKKERYKWDRLWSELPKNIVSQLHMDAVSMFSVTNMKTADMISKYLLGLPEITEASVVTDGTACVGGNAISFARYFKVVNAIELDPRRCEMLRHNFRMCLEADDYHRAGGQRSQMPAITGELRVVEGCCIDKCPPAQDIFFLDPPWGGKGYTKQDKTELFLSNKSLRQVCEEIGERTKYIALKLPLNASSLEHIQGFKLALDVNLGKINLKVFQVGRALSTDELSFLMKLGLGNS